MDSNTFFADIAIKFTATELLAHLESAEGGTLKVITSKDYNHLAIIRYVKGYSNMEHINSHYFRSVVWNKLLNKPVAISPFKSLPWSSYVSAGGYSVEDFWDGTMLNMFFDDSLNKWIVSTRSNIDASCRYHSSRSFHSLFWETFYKMTLNLGDFDKNTSYTWVLQHPENRIVVPNTSPLLRLVDIIAIDLKGNFNFLAVPPSSLMNIASRHLPLTGALATKEELEKLSQVYNNMYCQGFVVKDSVTGNRWKIRTSSYKLIRELRGNTPRLDYRLIELRSRGDLNNYLHYYSEDQPTWDALWNRLKDQTRSLYTTYCDVFKGRTLKAQDAPKYMIRMLYDMHDYYLNRLRPASQTMNWQACTQWVNMQDIPRQLFLANYLLVQKNKDFSFPYEPTDENLMARTTVVETDKTDKTDKTVDTDMTEITVEVV
jgi:hypothetical protein